MLQVVHLRRLDGGRGAARNTGGLRTNADASADHTRYDRYRQGDPAAELCCAFTRDGDAPRGPRRDQRHAPVTLAPRFRSLSYYSVLSAHASLRAEVVPKKAIVPVALFLQLPLFDESAPPSAKASAAKTTEEPSRHPWSWLLKRVFALDIMVCSRCGGALRIVKIATRPDDHVLGVLGSLRSLIARSARGGARSRRARFAARTSRGRADREHSRPARASLPLSSSTAPRPR